MDKEYKYTVNFTPAEEGGFIAEVPALPGCHTQGESLEETEKNIQEAIELYLETLKARGKEIPADITPIQKKVTLRVAGSHA